MRLSYNYRPSEQQFMKILYNKTGLPKFLTDKISKNKQISFKFHLWIQVLIQQSSPSKYPQLPMIPSQTCPGKSFTLPPDRFTILMIQGTFWRVR